MPLSFFTNAGSSYGSAIPFQRIVEPSQLGFFLNLEQAELLRIQRYNEAWRFYFGKHWMFKREEGDPLVTLNYYRKIIDKAVEFMVAEGFVIRTPESLEQVTKPFLDEVWEYNGREQMAWDAGTTGGVTGDVFFMITYEEPTMMQRRINPYSQGRIRINLLGSEQVFPTWDPIDTNTLTAVRIETIYYSDRGMHQIDRDDRANHEGRQLVTKRFTQIITPTQIVEQFHGEMPVIKPNVLGEIPLVHIKNVSLPKEYYGLPDGQDLIDPQREMNEKCTDVSDIISYQAAPITAVFGAKAKQLDRGPRNIWTGLPEKARIETIKLEGDLIASRNYIDFIKKAFHEISDTPEGALGAMQPISNTSGVALHMQYQPLIGKVKRKKATYEPGFEQINYFILRIGMLMGLINVPYDVCKNCGGRIIEIPNGKTTKVWDRHAQTFVEIPIRTKRCYEMDKQTLEFVDPFEMRVKYWRQYGFGKELRDMSLRKIHEEITGQQRSFWDYSALQEAAMEKWRQENEAVIQQSHQQQMANQPVPEGVGPGGEAVPAQGPAASDALIPKVVASPPQIKPPLSAQTIPLPDSEMDFPMEPERVTVTREFLHPETGARVIADTEELFLVPTDCKRPQYLNPYENQVEFNDVLPKDMALQSQLYAGYQSNGWVDEEWVQERIPEIAEDLVELRKRMKTRKMVEERMRPIQSVQTTTGGKMQQTTYGGELAPKDQPLDAVPGAGGNPVPMGQSQGGQ